jgi:hypothetical protein
MDFEESETWLPKSELDRLSWIPAGIPVSCVTPLQHTKVVAGGGWSVLTWSSVETGGKQPTLVRPSHFPFNTQLMVGGWQLCNCSPLLCRHGVVQRDDKNDAPPAQDSARHRHPLGQLWGQVLISAEKCKLSDEMSQTDWFDTTLISLSYFSRRTGVTMNPLPGSLNTSTGETIIEIEVWFWFSL